jgi:hypothetical protein
MRWLVRAFKALNVYKVQGREPKMRHVMWPVQPSCVVPWHMVVIHVDTWRTFTRRTIPSSASLRRSRALPKSLPYVRM